LLCDCYTSGLKPHHFEPVAIACPSCGCVLASCGCKVVQLVGTRLQEGATLHSFAAPYLGSDQEVDYDAKIKLKGPLSAFGPEGKVEIVLPIS
jgi:hypothetical protein